MYYFSCKEYPGGGIDSGGTYRVGSAFVLEGKMADSEPCVSHFFT
jgi:hypothetical protein